MIVDPRAHHMRVSMKSLKWSEMSFRSDSVGDSRFMSCSRDVSKNELIMGYCSASWERMALSLFRSAKFTVMAMVSITVALHLTANTMPVNWQQSMQKRSAVEIRARGVRLPLRDCLYAANKRRAQIINAESVPQTIHSKPYERNVNIR